MATNPLWPTIAVEIEFTPNVWTNITRRVRSISSAKRGRQYELAQPAAGSATFVIDNNDGALDPMNAASPYAPNVKLFKRIRVSASWGDTGFAYLWSGYVERYPQGYDTAGNAAVTTLVAVDELAKQAATILEPAYVEQLKSLAPSWWYELNDEAPITSGDYGAAVERTGAYGPGRLVTTGSAVAPVAAFAGATDAFVGAEGSKALQLTQSPNSVGRSQFANAGYPTTALVLPRGVGVPAAGPWTLAASFAYTGKVADLPSGSFMQLLEVTDDAGSGYFAVSVNPSGYLQVVVNDSAGVTHVPRTYVSAQTFVYDGSPHHLMLAMNAANTALTIAFDGLKVQTLTPASPATAFTFTNLRNVRVGAEQTTGSYYYGRPVLDLGFQGWVSNVALVPSELVTSGGVTAGGAALWQAASTAFAGDTTSGRASRVAAFGGVAIATTGTGNTAMQGAKLAGKTVAQVLTDCSTTESSLLFVSGAGVITLVNRANRYNAAPVRTFADAGAGYRYDKFVSEFDVTKVLNDVTLPRTGGGVSRARNAASITAYGRRALQVSLAADVTTDGEAQDAATYLVTRYAEPHLRISSLDIDFAGQAATNGLDLLVAIELNQPVKVVRTPLAGAAFTQLCFIESASYTLSPGVLRATFELSPADTAAYFTADDPVLGKADAGNLLAY